MVAVDEVGGAVGYGGVEQVPGRGAALEGVHGPAAAGDPSTVGVAVGVGAYGGDGGRCRTGVREVALGHLQSGGDRVDVGVLEAGDEQAACEVDDLRPRADELADLVVADGGDPVAGDGDRGGTGAGRVHREDGAAGEDEVGGDAVHGVFRFVPSAGWMVWCAVLGQAVSGTVGAVERPVTK